MTIVYTSNNTFIFSFVRMNPPTPGHLELVKTMIYKAIKLGVNQAYIITSSSLDGKNPLPCSSQTIPKPKNKNDLSIMEGIIKSDIIYKSSVLEKMINSYKQQLIEAEPDVNIKSKIENINIIILCSSGSPFGFIYNIIKTNYIDVGFPKINMIFIVGRDRADFLDTIVDNFKSKDYIISIDGIVLEREGMGEAKNTDVSKLNIEELKPSEYSGSLVRNLVRKGDRIKFEQVYNKYLTTEEIYKLYETIQIGMQMSVPKKSAENENPYSKYFDGRLLPVINSSAGRRLRKTRKNKRKTKRIYSRRKYNKCLKKILKN
jgi:hypothetical protein